MTKKVQTKTIKPSSLTVAKKVELSILASELYLKEEALAAPKQLVLAKAKAMEKAIAEHKEAYASYFEVYEQFLLIEQRIEAIKS